MSFTAYDPAMTLPRDVVRFEVNDKVLEKGPFPDGANFSDEEIAYLLTDEGDSTDGAIARCFEALQAAWAQYSLSEREGDINFDAKDLTDKYAALAEKWWKKSGRQTSAAPGFSEHQNIFHLGYIQ